MGIFDIFKPSPKPARVVSRPFDFYLPAIAVGATFRFFVDVHLPAAVQYKPLNFLEVYNGSNTILTVRYESEGGELFRIEANSSRIIKNYFNQLIFVNAGANALPANTAICTMQRI